MDKNKHDHIKALVLEEGPLTVLPREVKSLPSGTGGNWCVVLYKQLDKI
jgi:hypothetical protein